jgi:hypothetical protein
MNWSEYPAKLTHRTPKIWKQRKAELEELWRQGQNWALEELQQLRQAERAKSHLAYEQFKARRTPEGLRAKWREAKAAQRAAARAALAEAEERKRRDKELAAKEAALAAEAERERKSREAIADSGTEIELEILRIPPNPRMVICAYWAGDGERWCMVRVGRNASFRPGMKLLVQRRLTAWRLNHGHMTDCCQGVSGAGERFKGAFHTTGDDYNCCGGLRLAEAHKDSR